MKAVSRNVLWVVFFAAIACLLAMATLRDWQAWFWLDAPFEETRTVASLSNINYDSRLPLTTPAKTYNVDYPHEEQISTIQFRFKVSKFKDQMTLLDTAPNGGLKLTLDKKGRIALFVPDNYETIPDIAQSNENITPNVWHTLKIVAWTGHSVRVIIDGMMPIMFYQLEVIKPGIDFQISDIKVGTDANPQNNFIGQIADFSVTARLVDLHLRHMFEAKIHQLLGVLALIALLAFIPLGMSVMSKQDKVEYVAAFILVGFFAATVFHYILATYWKLDYPQNTFLIHGTQYGDFFISILQDWHLDPYRFNLSPGIYFPFSYVLIYPFVFLNVHVGLVVYEVIFVVFLLLFLNNYLGYPVKTWSDKLVNYKNIFVIALMSYPFIFSFERANFESLIFIFLALSIYFYQKQKFNVTAILVAMAGAMKIYPLFFIILFLSDRRYALTIKTIVLTGVFTLLGLIVLQPGYYGTLTAFLKVLQSTKLDYLFLPPTCTHFSAGLWGLMKILQQLDILPFQLL